MSEKEELERIKKEITQFNNDLDFYKKQFTRINLEVTSLNTNILYGMLSKIKDSIDSNDINACEKWCIIKNTYLLNELLQINKKS